MHRERSASAVGYPPERSGEVATMTGFFTSEAAVAFIQVVAIDLVLAGDNAVVIGPAAAGLPPQQQCARFW